MQIASATADLSNPIQKVSSKKQTTNHKRLISGVKMKFAQLRIVLHTATLIFKKAKSFDKFLFAFRQLWTLYKVNMGDIGLRKYVQSNGQLSWSMYAPPWPSAELNKLLNLELDYSFGNVGVESPLHFVFLSITKECPLQCEHCYEWDIMHKPEVLSLNNLKTIVRKFQDQNISSVFLSGGEPLSRYNDLLELVRYSSEKSKTWVITSGYSLTLKKAEELKQAGLYGTFISIDHYKEESHNAFRGSPHSFQKAIQAVGNANEAGLMTAISICVTKSFISEENLNNYMEFAKELNVGYVQFFEPKREGNYKDRDVLLNNEQIHLLESFFRNFNSSKQNDAYPLIIYQGYHQRKSGCYGGGKRFLYVDSNGDIQACPFCPSKMGNALDESWSFSQGICKQYDISKN